MPLLFAITMFVSASLLFMVQPMVAKAVLPLLGGSPAVWNGCMVFFQALLLLGYLYADRLTRVKDTKKQWMIHIGVLALPITVFVLAILFGAKGTPIAVVEGLAPKDGSSPVISVLMILTVAIGIPFFVCSTTATLLQKWFTYTGHPSARDPYFLYAASNFGSLISLLGYPIFIEPNLTQGGQTWIWAIGFAALAALIASCGKAAVNPLGVPPGGKASSTAATATAPTEAPPTWERMAKWTLLAFVPSSLMLGVTFHMTTDIASIPLLWVGPLALYLITFIIAFGRVPSWFRILIGNLAPVMILLLVFLLISSVSHRVGVGVTLLLHLLTFFAAALMCHYELALDRPSPQYLTTYFLIMSLGGVLGGIFNSLLAPIIFAQDYEYKLVMVIACLMVPRLITSEENPKDAATGVPLYTEAQLTKKKRISLILDIVIPVIMGLLFWRLLKIGSVESYGKLLTALKNSIGISIDMLHTLFVYAVPVMACFFFVDRPVRFALCVAAILGITVLRERGDGVIYTERSFFGILKIEDNEGYEVYLIDRSDRDNPIPIRNEKGDPILMHKLKFRRLVHGTTLHGTQVVEQVRHPWDALQQITAGNVWDNLLVVGAQTAYDARQEPLTYYHRTGPVGAMFTELRRRKGGADAKADVAMVGLGTGSASCYALPGQRLTFYEIDPTVKKLVADTDKYFSYVSDGQKRGATIDFRMGDARLKLKEDTDRKYALLLVDAFSSDSIPVHLLTNEAVQLYLDRLTDDGILALHISNKFVRLEPVVAAIAKHHNLDARVWNDDSERGMDKFGKTASSWVVLGRKREHLGDRLASPIGDLIGKYGSSVQLMRLLKELYPELGNVIDKEPTKQQDVLLAWLDKRTGDEQAKFYATLVRKHGAFATLMTILQAETGYGFRPVELLDGVDAWTDDYADVMRVMMIPELQALRKFFGLPTPVER